MQETYFKALRVQESTDKTFTRKVEQRQIKDLPDGELLVNVSYAALNYKDALSAIGNKGVSRHYPHTPGIDAAGIVAESTNENFKAGEEVIVTSYDLGMNTDGGFAEYIRVPAAWVVKKPASLSLYESMVIGTAGFTAALALYKMEKMGQQSAMGSVLVTGASGGVGSLAVAILSKAGYEVIASTGKTEAHKYLSRLGARQCVDRAFANDDSRRPLLKPQWAAAIDTVGGNTLVTALKACKRAGTVASCGLVGSPKIEATVFPFIINGVNLIGVDSANCEMNIRQQVWDQLAQDWKPEHLSSIATDCSLEELDPYIDQILAGKVRGRVIVGM